MSGCVYASDLGGSAICKKWIKPQTLHFKQYSGCNKSHNASQRSLPGWTHLICTAFANIHTFTSQIRSQLSSETKRAFRIGGLELVVRPCSKSLNKGKDIHWIPFKKEKTHIHGNKILMILYHAQEMLYGTIIKHDYSIAGIYCLNGLKENIPGKNNAS